MENDNIEIQTEAEGAGPEAKPDTPEWHEKLIKYCVDLYDTFEKSAYRAKILKEMDESYVRYELEEEKTDFPFENASNHILPMLMITVDNQEPRLVAGLIGKEPIVRFDMTGMEEQDQPTKILEDWFNKELKNAIRIKNATIDMVHLLLLEGTVFAIPKYEVNEKRKRAFVLDGNTGLPVIDPQTNLRVTQELNEVISEGGQIEIIPITDIYCADDIGTLEEWNEASKIRITRPTYAELQRRKTGLGWQNIGPWLLTYKKKTGKEDGSPGQQIMDVEVTGKEVIECLECHVTYPVYQDEKKEEREQTDFTEEHIVVTIAKESNTIVRMVKRSDLLMENDSLIKRLRINPQSGRTYGRSVYSKLKSVQNGSSEFFNLVLNIAYLVMMPWFFYDAKAGLRGKIELVPGKGIAVDNVQGIKFPEFRMNPREYLEFLNTFFTLWERIGNISDTQIGRPKDQTTTATEILTVVQEGNIKHNYQSETLKEEYIALIRTLYDLYYERMNPQKMLTYNGQQVPMPFAMMRRNYRFVLAGSTETANKYINRREKEDLMKMLGGDPYIIPTKPREELLESYGIDNVAEWINPMVKQITDIVLQNPEVGQIVGQYMQEKAAVQAAIKPGAAIGGKPGGTAGRPGGAPEGGTEARPRPNMMMRGGPGAGGGIMPAR